MQGHKSELQRGLCPQCRGTSRAAIPPPTALKSLSAPDKLAVATHDALDEDTLRTLAADSSIKVREAVAQRDELPEDVILALAHDDHDGVRSAALSRKDVPAEVIAEQASGPLGDVIAKNPSSTPGALRAVFDQIVQGIPRSGVGDGGRGLSLLAQNPSTPPDLLSRIARVAGTQSIVQQVAVRDDVPLDLLIRLANESNIGVRASAARNPSLPDEVMRELRADNLKATNIGLVANPNAPDDLVKEIWNESLLSDDDAYVMDVREAIAKNQSGPVDVLRHLVDSAWDDNSRVVTALQRNRSLPPALLSTLHQRFPEKFEASVRRYLSEALGVDESNTEAASMVLAQDWWTMTPESKAVVVALAVHHNP